MRRPPLVTLEMYSVLVQIMTGHNYMPRHQNIIDKANRVVGPGPICTLCQEGEQSSQHIIGECGALNDIRFKHFDAYQLSPPFTALKKSALIGYLRDAPIDELHFFIEAAHN